jgi:glutathione S-transferase
MEYIELVTVVAVLQFFFFGAMTGNARRLSGLKAPAMSGNEQFERMYRVQMNTLETLVVFLPALFLASKYWPSVLIVTLGSLYIVGRHIYWRAYVSDPSKRTLGFMISIIPTLTLLLLAVVGIIWSIVAPA